MQDYLKYLYKNIKQYKWKSIFVQNFSLCVAIIILPVIAMNCAFYILYTSSAKNDFETKNNNTLVRCANLMDSLFTDLSNNVARLIGSSDVRLFLENRFEDLAPKTLSNANTNIQELFSGLSMTNDAVHSIYLYSKLNDYIISTTGSNYSKDFYDGTITGILRNAAPEKTEIVQRTIYLVNQRPVDVISIITPIYPYLNSSGTIVVNLSTRELTQELETALDPSSGDRFAIVSSNDILLYDSDSQASYHYGSDLSQIPDTVSLSSSSSIYNLSYRLVSSQFDYYHQQHRLLILIGLFAFLSVLITVAFSLLLTVKTSRPIGSLLDIIEHPDQWADDQQLTSAAAENELNFIITNILGMFHITKSLPEQTAIRTALLKKAQTIALQAQINPHFLFNTLEAIYLSASDLTGGEENETTNMVSALSDLLRLSFKTKEILVPIADELEMVSKYLLIQQYRYEDMFQIRWEVDPAILSYQIVKLSLQPFLENALYHGVKPAGRFCTITIQGFERSDAIVLSVSDDGVGIAPEEFSKLLEKLEDTSLPEDEHIGITNVHRRIRLTFGEPYGVTIDSPSSPTTFSIIIPKTKNVTEN